MLQQIVLFLGSLGLKKTWSAISQFPAMILLPTITFWTYSGIDLEPSAKCNAIARKSDLKLSITNHHQIGVSMFFTWINFLMTLGGMLIYINYFAVQLTSSQCRFKDLTCKKTLLLQLKSVRFLTHCGHCKYGTYGNKCTNYRKPLQSSLQLFHCIF